MLLITGFYIDIPVNATISHIINDKSKRWNIQIFSAVHTHSQQIFLPITQLFADIHGKSRVSAVMLRHLFPVQKHFTLMGNALKGKYHILPAPAFRYHHLLSVSADHLIQRFIKIMVRKLLARVRNLHILHSTFVE